jgi:AraC-like DNA-binding protein
MRRIRKLDTSRLVERVPPRVKTRGVPPALRDHLVFATSDPAEASARSRGIFGPCRLLPVGPDAAEFEASWHSVRCRDITLGHLDFCCEAEMALSDLPGDYLVLIPMSGSLSVSTPGATMMATPIRAVLPQTEPPLLLFGHQTSLLVVVIDRPVLISHLSRLLGRPLEDPLVFELEMDLSHPNASRWNVALQMLQAELLDASSLLHQGVGVGQLEELLMSSLLFGQKSNYTPALTDAYVRAEHRATRVAKDFIARHLREAISVKDVADAAGVSIRTLESAFQTDLATTPTRYIQNCRIDRIRADLADAAPGATVTEIATRWGMHHLSRFARDYKDRFGESPSKTLRG